MTSPIPTTAIASFGSYTVYLAARLDGPKTTNSLSQCEVYGKNASYLERDGDGEETVEIGPIGYVVNLNETWVEIRTVTTCSLGVREAELLRIE